MAARYLSDKLIFWLKKHADSLDQSNEYADEIIYRLAEGGIFKQGIPIEQGGAGNSLQDAINAIAEVAKYSLTAAFCAWGHRTLLENLWQSSQPLHQKMVRELLSGKRAGGTGLSNAVKFTSGVEELNVSVYQENGKYYLRGRLPWVTNLRADCFAIIFSANYADNLKPPIVLAIPSEAGLQLSPELPLIALKASRTHPVILDNIELNPEWIIASNLLDYLTKSRPSFLGLQFGMAFGLAKRALQEVEKSFGSNRDILYNEWKCTKAELEFIEGALQNGLASAEFVQNPKALFQLRIDIVDVVASAVLLELQAGGGRGYIEGIGSDFIRRWREAAFLPIVTPSAVQLRLVLSQFEE
ncbi:acyl-CoA dehydrogenase family protein [Rodentibacter caecimuris]|uniref:Dehydrogenase n=1 Tax=Rodentibacter caecimuris TaxID=1796644 RepID=A0ABX3L3E3_9PAST|nr:dehydrogenase [Rodentibacter heylii]